MKVTETQIPNVKLIEPNVFEDKRGFFYESFNQKLFEDAVGLHASFVQDNHSKSTLGVLRGLHYQLSPKAQGKLVRVVNGEIFDVAVDIRKESPSYGKWVGAHLSAANKRQLWIPQGFAHGYLTLSQEADVLYKTTDYYSPEHERIIAWNDQVIAIDWPVSAPILSEKDASAGSFDMASL
ncbi:MAG: dTDP-4-dehydrorhamnose 3,5-epimerase [Sedimenticola thiotaurini]|uniref:dTDP-4-dehydrorhamnose 3,5-epimerase n=1 Tax=Sedimenticola thiotaurini TaxID=1543721 RepID=A0A558DAU4_9GAMM|nr:MAG: dTDP-4-dehydrorhamnose 3,5-epimerase [Sedimenticola thiotaurini]